MNRIQSNNIFFYILLFLINLIPISLLSGSLVTNIFHALISVFFIFEIILKRKFYLFNDYFVYLLLFLWLTFIINLFFSSNYTSGLPRSIGFIRFILIILAIKYVLLYNNAKYLKIILFVWTLFFLLVAIDLLIEFYSGSNIFGYKSNVPGRLASFLNDELKIGAYFLAFGILFICTFYKYVSKNFIYIIIISILILIISHLIGERSNFIKLSAIIILFLCFNYKQYLIKTTIILSISFFAIIFLSTFNEKLKYRYIDQLASIEFKDNYYFKHYETSLSMFKENKLFGVGIKNFRNEIYNKKYFVENEEDSRHIITTHPHQINFELLAETGLFGYLSFLIFSFLVIFKVISSYIANKNILTLMPLLCFLVYINPILPSGSFFTTYSATIFWLNFSIMISFLKFRKK